MITFPLSDFSDSGFFWSNTDNYRIEFPYKDCGSDKNMDTSSYDMVIGFLPDRLKRSLEKVSSDIRASASEIRLRAGKPVSLTAGGEQLIISEHGGVSRSAHTGIVPTENELATAFETVCRSSVHCFKREISLGFVTLKGGHRVGFCGTAVHGSDGSLGINHISGMNYRIARQIRGAADELVRYLPKSGGMLIAGAPSSGKTTYLRDLCRFLGNKHKVALIDDTGELAAVYRNEPQNDVGVFTDVLTGYGKANGLETAVRVLSPEYIICDEIGSREDCAAIEAAANSGVIFIAAVHAGNMRELMAKPHIRPLINMGIFTQAVFLEKCRIKGVSYLLDRENEMEVCKNGQACGNGNGGGGITCCGGISVG